jgi:hypothetical protein
VLDLKSVPPIMLDLGTMWNGSWIVATMLQVNRKYCKWDFLRNRFLHRYINLAILMSQQSEDLDFTLKVDPPVREVIDIPPISFTQTHTLSKYHWLEAFSQICETSICIKCTHGGPLTSQSRDIGI